MENFNTQNTYKPGLITLSRIANSIYLCYSYKNESFVKSTGVRISSSDWDGEKRRVRHGVENYLVKEAQIRYRFQVMVVSATHVVEDGFIPDANTVKSYYTTNLKRYTDQEAILEFWRNVQDYIDSKYYTTIIYQDKLKLWVETLIAFEKETMPFNWKKQTLEPYPFARYLNFLSYNSKYADNTVRGFSKMFKSFMHEYYHEHYWHRYIKTLDLQPLPITLTEMELMKLLFIPLEDKEDAVRLIFCMLCLTGMELNDLIQFKDWGSVTNYFEYNRNRTGLKAFVAITDSLKYCIGRFKGVKVDKSAGYYNRSIKALFWKLGYTREVISREFITGRIIDTPKSLSKVVCMTTGHQTFIQLLFDKGFSMEDVMTMTGIVSEECFAEYNHPHDEDEERLCA
ncbi:MAG: hypothetical protein PHT77_01510 [Bacteroidales bacterium]|nr:hypothetical protein [Bacteroidales bacterium]